MDEAGGHGTGRAVRPQRADARSNRIRILEIAEEVFARGGESASTEEVARLAGVGIATVFRHFPTKQALLEAVLVGHLERLRDRAQALAGAGDPGRAFFDFFAYMVADATTKMAIAGALVADGGDTGGEPSRVSGELRVAVGVLLEHAQRAGAVRDDIELPELYALLMGASRAAAYARLDEGVRARSLAIVFDGLAPRPARTTRRDQP